HATSRTYGSSSVSFRLLHIYHSFTDFFELECLSRYILDERSSGEGMRPQLFSCDCGAHHHPAHAFTPVRPSTFRAHGRSMSEKYGSSDSTGPPQTTYPASSSMRSATVPPSQWMRSKSRSPEPP